MEDKNNIIVDTLSQISGNLVSETVELATGCPCLGDILGPIVTSGIKDVLNRSLSNMENQRIDIVFKQIKTKVEQRIEKGDLPRRDDDFYVKDEYGQTSASKLLEETLIKCKQEFEAKKLNYYANFWANVCFENNVSYEDANSLIALFSTLSYQQINILTYLASGENIMMKKWDKYMFSDSSLAHYFTFYTDCLQLYNTRLAVQPIAVNGGIQVGTPNICISSSGRLMRKLFEFEIKEDDRKRILDQIQAIDSIIKRIKY